MEGLMLSGKIFEISVLCLSFLVVVASYLLIVWKDRSWINWATPAFFISVGSKYFFQFLYLCYSPTPGGSHYAYAYCYTTYSLTFLIGAVVYVLVRPLKLRLPDSPGTPGALSWALLLLGFLLYLPVLIEFRAYLLEPRRIYEQTRTGYGLYFYGSTTLVTIAFITFLFSKRRGLLHTVFFVSVCILLAYLHGSKGQMITYLLIWMLHRVYVDRLPIRAFAASFMLLAAAGLLMVSFALFGSVGDVADLAESVTSYADYVRNAMLVIDDASGRVYYGQLTAETEFYSRVPRFLLPGKPKDFGAFALAKTYFPAAYRNDEGAPDFNLGVVYADFGPLSILLLCIYSALSALFISSLVHQLRKRGGSGPFIVFLFMSGVSLIPIGGAYFLPESLLLCGAISIASRFRFLHYPGVRIGRV